MATESHLNSGLGVKDTCVVPDEIDLSWLADYSLTGRHWLSHLSLVLVVVLLVRLVWRFDAVSRLLRLVRLLATLATASGRARRAERSRHVELVKELRAQLRTVNMTDQFATYSKLQRRLKEACRQVDKLTPDTLQATIVRSVTIRAVLFPLESLLLAWLVSRTPHSALVTRDLMDTLAYLLSDDRCRPVLAGSAPGVLALFSSGGLLHSTQMVWWPVLSVLCHLPGRLVTAVWVLLCRQLIAPPLVNLASGTAALVTGRPQTAEDAETTEPPVVAD